MKDTTKETTARKAMGELMMLREELEDVLSPDEKTRLDDGTHSACTDAHFTGEPDEEDRQE